MFRATVQYHLVAVLERDLLLESSWKAVRWLGDENFETDRPIVAERERKTGIVALSRQMAG